MSRDDAIFWVGVAVFGDGLYLVADHPMYGIPLIFAGVGLLMWSNRGHMPRPPLRFAALIAALLITAGIAGYDLYDRYLGNSSKVPTISNVRPPLTESTPPSQPRSKQAINELLEESGAFQNVVERAGLPLANAWQESITTQNPERICFDMDSRTLQDKITTLANKLDAAHREISNIYEKNSIDQAEFNKIFGSTMVGVGPAGFAVAAQSLRQYAHEINLLGEHPSCEVLIRTGNIPSMSVNMSRGFDQFSIWVAQSRENLSRYRDNLRKELRNAP
jgi:hypothetical protein